MTKFIPGLNKIKDVNNQDDQMKWTKAIIQSMTEKERENPEIINGSRRLRIAKGSGRNVSDVNKLIKQVAKNKKAYRYLEESISQFPNQSVLLSKINQIGFKNTSAINLFNGIVAIHTGYKL